ncbi:MAG: AlbA family DNA-binding domain-containing protein [Aridibacter sp.]
MKEFPWEDALLERKTENDLRDLLKTMVAFANSVRPEHSATILIGERDDGTVRGVKNPDAIQKRVRKEADKIYPAIIWRSQIYEKDAKFCVRVEIEYSHNTPHFGGISWVRKGSETIKASEEVFQTLIDLRSSKVRELSKWIGKEITIYGDDSDVPTRKDSFLPRLYSHRWEEETKGKIILVNQFWLTILVDKENTFEKTQDIMKSESLDKITISYDDENNRLKIIVVY